MRYGEGCHSQHLPEGHFQLSCEGWADEREIALLAQTVKQQTKGLIQKGCCEPPCTKRRYCRYGPPAKGGYCSTTAVKKEVCQGAMPAHHATPGDSHTARCIRKNLVLGLVPSHLQTWRTCLDSAVKRRFDECVSHYKIHGDDGPNSKPRQVPDLLSCTTACKQRPSGS